MLYAEERKQAEQVAGSALDKMRELAVPANPCNFTIWYNYVAGRIEELCRTIDVLMSNGREFDNQVSEELYERFFDLHVDGSAERAASARIQEVLSEIVGLLDATDEDANDYGAALGKVTARLASAVGGDELREIAAGILEKTHVMQARNHALEETIKQSSEEIADLRDDLESARQEALTDPLTRVANRKCFETRLRECAKEAMEDGQPMSLLMLDVDHFKKFNDTHGHLIGDKVLVLVARTLVESLKGRDVPTRYGGEEFAVILPATTLTNAMTVAENIRSTIASRRIVMKNTGEEIGAITASFGVAQYRPGEPLGDLIARADAALYGAKESGRNRIVSEGLNGETVRKTA